MRRQGDKDSSIEALDARGLPAEILAIIPLPDRRSGDSIYLTLKHIFLEKLHVERRGLLLVTDVDHLFTSITNPKLKSNGSDCGLQFVFKCLFLWQLGPVPVQRPDHFPAPTPQPRASSLAATVSDISCSKE